GAGEVEGFRLQRDCHAGFCIDPSAPPLWATDCSACSRCLHLPVHLVGHFSLRHWRGHTPILFDSDRTWHPVSRIEQKFLTAAIGVIAVSLIIGVHLLFPLETGFVPPAVLFLYFVTNVVASSAILFVIVFYALRQIARAEATAELEYD